jgi:outer membrane receptor protein involved in Fe transport
MERRRVSPRLGAAVAATLGTGLPCSPLLAQAVVADDGTQLETIVVTATRRDTNVQDVPFNIVALGPEYLDRLRIDTLDEFTRAVPGLYVPNQGPRGSNLVTVRGLNVSSLNDSVLIGNGTGGSVATYLGDIPLYVDLKMLDLQRVEALLGPQGTLYGAGTLAGAIRYLPNRPDPTKTEADVGGRVYAVGESDGLGTQVQGMFNVPLVADRLALRIAAAYLDDPGFIDYRYLVREPGVSNPDPDYSNPADVKANLRTKKDADTEETFTGRVGLFWQVTDALEANLTYYYQDQKVGARTVNHRASYDTGRYVSAERFLEPNDKTNQLLALELNWDLGFAELTSVTGASKFESDGQRDQTDLLMDFDYGYEDFPAFAAYVRDKSEEKTFNQELRLVSKIESRWNWIAGAFYNHFDSSGSSAEHTPGYPEWYGFPPGTPDLEYFALSDQTFTESAIFGELGYQLTDAWQVTVGARWFKFDADSRLRTAFPFLSDPPGTVEFSGDHNKTGDDDTIFKFNTSYKLTADLMTYLTISEGYRSGGVNVGPICEDPIPPGQNFCLKDPQEVLIKPDKTTNYELGLRSLWLEGRLIVNADLYYIDWKDIQVQARSEVGGLSIIRNGESAKSSGVEFSTQWRITDELELGASYSYNDAKMTQRSPGIVDGEDALSGDRLAGSPKQQGTLLLGYTRPLAGGLAFTADYSVTAVSDVYTKVGLRNNGEALPGYAIHGLSVGLDSGRWVARLYADNVFDKYAITSVRRDRSYIRQIERFDPVTGDQIPSIASRSYFQSPLRPRTVGLEFTYHFDL